VAEDTRDDEPRPDEDDPVAGDLVDELAEEARESRRWSSASFQDEYGLALALFLAVMVLPIFLPDDEWANGLIAGVAAAGALIALHSSRVQRWVMATAAASVVLMVVFVTVGGQDDTPRAIFYGSVGFLLFATPVAILVRISQHKVITPRTLYGAICVYLLLGLGFSFIYQAVDHADPNAFPAVQAGQRVSFTYYSFITLTTVGYGDIVPATDSARSLATFEAVLGQVFLVVVVARVVAMLGQERTVPTRPVLRRIHRTDPEDDGHDDGRDRGPSGASD
jgi:hypothetical protein